MDPRKILNLFAIIGISSCLACTRNTLDLPEPAKTIEGVYVAQNNEVSFPIQGQTLQLTVQRVAADSVSVVVRAVINGQVSDSLSYQSAYVGQEYDIHCVGYRVYLTSQDRLDQLSMTCSEVNVFRYIYKPAGEQTYTTVRFKKV